MMFLPFAAWPVDDDAGKSDLDGLSIAQTGEEYKRGKEKCRMQNAKCRMQNAE